MDRSSISQRRTHHDVVKRYLAKEIIRRRVAQPTIGQLFDRALIGRFNRLYRRRVRIDVAVVGQHVNLYRLVFLRIYRIAKRYGRIVHGNDGGDKACRSRCALLVLHPHAHPCITGGVELRRETQRSVTARALQQKIGRIKERFIVG